MLSALLKSRLSTSTGSPSGIHHRHHHHYRGRHGISGAEKAQLVAEMRRAFDTLALNADLVDLQLRTGGEEGLTDTQLLRCGHRAGRTAAAAIHA